MPTSNYQTIEYSQSEKVVTIRLNRPEAANGLNVAMAAELSQAARRVAADPSVKAVVLTGNGKLFCAGGDLKAIVDFGDDVGAGLKGIADDLHRAMSAFTRMAAPLIVAVNGTAAGAGFSMAVFGDLVLAAESAKFTMAYSKIGLSPDGGSSYFLPRLIGLRRTQELMFTNRVLNANEALEWGLVNRVVASEDLMEEANKLAKDLAEGALNSNSSIKQLLLQTFDNGLETQMEREGVCIANNATTADGREGLAAFLEKRAPKYS